MTENLPATPKDADGDPLYFRADQRQKERLTEIPALYRTNHERLACELALKMDSTEDVFQRYGYTPEGAAELMESPAFTALLARIGIEIRENGLSFRQKAKAIAEELLPTAFDIATDPLQSAAVRADLIKWAAKVAGHEPNPKDTAPGAATFSLHLTFAGQPPEKIITGREPLTLENGEAI